MTILKIFRARNRESKDVQDERNALAFPRPLLYFSGQ